MNVNKLSEIFISTVRHPLIDNDLHSRIIRQLTENSSQYTALNPLIIADIGCGDGSFTNNLISNIIINKLNIEHVTKYLIDPFGNRDTGNVITLSDREFSDAFPSNHCDIIICKSVAHFFKNFFYWIHHCCRILKPNGISAWSIWGKKEQCYFFQTFDSLFKQINKV